jgi:hypothetical protein
MVPAALVLMSWLVLRGRPLWLRRMFCLWLLRLLRRDCACCLAAFVLAAAPAAPMPLLLSLPVGRYRPLFTLGLRKFCRHALVSCCIAADLLPSPASPPTNSGRETRWRTAKTSAGFLFALKPGFEQAALIPAHLRHFHSYRLVSSFLNPRSTTPSKKTCRWELWPDGSVGSASAATKNSV